MMLQRNLLYTGVTRAKKLIILAGSRRALAQAVRTRGAGRRHTALSHRLNPTGHGSQPPGGKEEPAVRQPGLFGGTPMIRRTGAIQMTSRQSDSAAAADRTQS
jgi:hypothetical protein